MKKVKAQFVILGSLLACGVLAGANFANEQILETKATSTALDDIYGKMRPTPDTLVISTKTVAGTKGALYTGNVFDAKGNALPITLKPNEGASGDWAGEGTRRFDFNVGDQTFKDAIGTGSEFFITKESVFVNGTDEITFAKEYAFKSIWNGGFNITEANYSEVSFKFAEAVAKPESAKYRVSIKDLSGISAGFTQYFHGTVKDKNGADVAAKIFDAGDGSTPAGNRKVYVLLEKQVSDNIFFVQKDSTFYSYDLTKKVTFDTFYGIQPTVLTTCDGSNHTLNDQETLCLGCGQTFTPQIITPTITPTLGTTYWSEITAGDPNSQVMLKVGGCSDLTGADATYRGTAKLDGNDVSLKITVSGTDLRFYIYVAKDSAAATSGHLYIDSSTKFASDPANSYMQFSSSFYLGYDNANHIYKCDGSNHTYGEAVEEQGSFVSYCKGCGESKSASIFKPTLGTTYWSQITAGDPNSEVMLKVGGCSDLTGADATYRGTAKLDGNDISLKITVSGTDLRFYIYVAKDSAAATSGHLYIDSSTKFASDPANSYMQFSSSFYLGYDNANHIFKCDGSNHTYGQAVEKDGEFICACKGCGDEKSATIYTASLGTSDKWASNDGSDTKSIAIKIGGCTGVTGAASVYRGNGKLNGNTQALKITVDNNVVRIFVYLEDVAPKTGVIEISKDTTFAENGNANPNSYFRFDKSIKVQYNLNTNKYRIDTTDYEYVESVISNVTKKNWISKEGTDVVLSYNNVTLSNGAVTKSAITLYRGVAQVDGVDKTIRVGLQNVNDTNKLVFYFPGEDGSTLSVSKNSVFYADVNGTYFGAESVKLADSIKFEDDLSLKVDIENNMVNPKDVLFSFSGTGNWSQSVDSQEYNALASFNDCTISGIYQDESEIHPDTQKHRGYHFYGVGYDKADDTTEVNVDIWVSDFADGDETLNQATVKTAVYVNLPNAAKSAGVKLHKDTVFVCSAYNMKMTLDADYLIKWYQDSSRTTAGKYNDDQVGPTIVIDELNIPEYTEGDEQPTLPAACYDDVDDVVTNVSQTWQEGAVTDGKLNAGSWEVTITAQDEAHNEATPVVVTVTVNEKVEPQPEQPENEETKKGCFGSVTVSCALVSGLALAGLALVAKKQKEDK